jgi:alpha-ribazole phosphatase
MELYLVRHTTPDIAAGICYGQTDIGVAITFANEAEILHGKLKQLVAPVIYTSPLQRCSRLAMAIADKMKLAEVKHDPRLMELHFGEWEMQAWNDIPRGEIDVWAEEHVAQAPPQGESFQALYLRAKAFLEEVSVSINRHSVVVFTHAGVIRALVAEVLNLPLVNSFRLQIDYGSVTKIILDGEASRIGFVNR